MTQNGNTLWWDAICDEMKNVRVAFELFEGTVSDLPPGHQLIDCHMTFDIKIGKGFQRKARMVVGGHKTVTPTVLTHSSAVSRDSI